MVSNGALTKGLMGTKLPHTNYKSFPLYLDNIIHTIEIIKSIKLYYPGKKYPISKVVFKPAHM